MDEEELAKYGFGETEPIDAEEFGLTGEEGVMSFEEATGAKEPITSHEAWVLSVLFRGHWNGLKPIAHRMFLAADVVANFEAFAPEHRGWSARATQCNVGILLKRFMPNIVRKTIGAERRTVYILPNDAKQTALAAVGRTEKEVDYELWGL